MTFPRGWHSRNSLTSRPARPAGCVSYPTRRGLGVDTVQITAKADGGTMPGGGPIDLVRDPRQVSGTTFLELFFDLAFVFAFTRLSQELHKDVTWFGVWDTLLTLLALWWVWSTTVWMTERLDPD